MLQIQVNLCGTVQLLTGILLCNGRKLEEAEGCKCIYIVYCVRMEIDVLMRELLSNNSLFNCQSIVRR